MLEDKVSVLIPTYNAAPYLDETLMSVVSQIRQTDEIVIIDDHSTDDSLHVAHKILGQEHANHIIKKNPNKGACSARNHALEMATGTLIQWLDADDILGTEKIERQRQWLLNKPHSISIAPFRPFKDNIDTGIIKENRQWPAKQSNSPAEWLSSNFMTIPACWLGHRTVFENAGPWDTSLKVNQDGEYFARVLAATDAVHYESKVEVYYRRGVKRSVSQFTANKAESLYRSVESIHKTALSIEDSTRMRQMVANLYQHAIYTAYPHCPEGQEQAERQLERLPTPDIQNPNAISALSKAFTRVFGWKALTRARMLRHRLNA